MTRIALWLFMAGIALAQSPDGGNPERPAVIAGRIIAADGRPLVNVGVEAIRLDYHDGSPYLKDPNPGVGLRSDDRGEYRISVPPGDYYVRTLLSVPSGGTIVVTQFANTMDHNGLCPCGYGYARPLYDERCCARSLPVVRMGVSSRRRGKDDAVVAPDFLDRYKDDAIPVTVEPTKTIANLQLQLIPWK